MENKYYSRWYDKDPILSMSMRTLSNSTDERQIKVALNLIKVIIEHNIQDNKFENVEDIMTAVEEGRIQRGYCRWYDIDSTVRTAIQMLEKCTNETKKKVAIDMAQIVIEKIIQDDDKDEIIKEEKENLEKEELKEEKEPKEEIKEETKEEEIKEVKKVKAVSINQSMRPQKLEFEGREIDLDLDEIIKNQNE